MVLIICRDPTPRIPREYVDHPRTSSIQWLEEFMRKQARRGSRP